jgi:hypothetical protein
MLSSCHLASSQENKMQDINFIAVLALVTLLLGVAYGVWQLFMVKRAKETNEHSSLTQHKEPGRRNVRDR